MNDEKNRSGHSEGKNYFEKIEIFLLLLAQVPVTNAKKSV